MGEASDPAGSERARSVALGVRHTASLARLGRRALVLGFLSCAACSLQGLDRVGYTRCNDDTACAFRNEGIADNACIGWECSAGYCRLRPRDADRDGRVRLACALGTDCDDFDPTVSDVGLEICDGRDQDCDRAIDEELADPEVLNLPMPIVLFPLPAGASLLSIDAVSDGRVSAAFLDSSRGAGYELVSSRTPFTPSAPFPLSFATLVPPTALGPGCARTLRTPILAEPSCVDASDCAGAEVCAARADGLRVCGSGLATCATDAECGDGLVCNGLERCAPADPSADARGCAPASVRRACALDETCEESARACVSSVPSGCSLRDFAAAPAGEDFHLAAAVGSACAAGSLRIAHFSGAEAPRQLVALGRGGRSSSWDGIDTDESGCTGASRASGVLGARGPSIATFTGGGATPAGLVAYLGGPLGELSATPVEIVGVWLERDAMGNRWSHATGSGVPTVLSGLSSASTTRPAVLSIEAGLASAFVVAFGADGGGVALHVVRRLGEPAATCPAAPMPALEACLTTTMPAATLFPGTSLEQERTSAPLGAPVATIASGSIVEGDVSLALGPPSIVGGDSEIALAYLEAGEAVLALGTLGASGAITFPPARTYRVEAAGAQDISVARISVGLTTPGDDRRTGGYVVSWSSPSGTFVARYRDDAPTLGPGRNIGDAVIAPRAVVLDLGLAAERLSVVGRDADGDVVAFPFACGRAP